MASLLEKYGWHEWLCHTNFSFLTGASHPEEYVRKAFELNYSGLGIVDYDGVYGIVRAYRELNGIVKEYKLESKPLSLSYGAELHFQKDHDLPVIYQDTLALKALNMNGYFNLCRLLTLAHEGGKHDAHVAFDRFASADLRDLVFIQPMRGIIRTSSQAKIEERLATLKSLVGDRLCLAVTRTLSPAEDRLLPMVFDVGRRLCLPVVFSQDSFMHTRKRKALSDVLHAIRHNKSIDDISSQLFANGERSFHSLEHIEKIYSAFPDFETALKYSCDLSNRFEFDLNQISYRYPKELVPDGMTTHEYLADMTWMSAKSFYKGSIPEKIEKLLQYELKMIAELQFADYFLTVWDIVRWARSQGILCQGRGSAANSSVCFVLGVTAVDPTKFDVLFERFISVERGDPPDIDVDFEHERREEVIQYIYERFGRKRAAMVANVITFKSKGCLRFTGKALGIDERLIGESSELISSKHFRGSTLPQVLGHLRSQQSEEMQSSVPWAYWARLAEQVHGFPRHMGIHSGGFVVSDSDLSYLCHQEPATMEGRSVIAWSKDDVEALGFFKIDVLALGMLTAVRKCLTLVKDSYGVDIDLARLSYDDKATYRMLHNADTVGTFQVESRAQMSMLPRLRPENLYDLVVEVGIVRPGPLQGGFVHPYLKRRQNREAITYPHPKLKPILERTMGIPIFQEQVMRMAIEIGGFMPGEADELRRQMGAWNFRGDLGPLVKKLAQGMRERGISEKFVQQVLQQIKGFAEYGFPESHAVSFALIAYVSCYLKCHFPAAFTASLLNSQPLGFYSPHALIQDAKRHGIQIRPICVNHSDWDSHLEETGYKGQYAIRLGLRLVRGLSKKSGQYLVGKRRANSSKWSDVDSFLLDMQLDCGSLLALASADALSIFGLSRRSAVWMAMAYPYAAPIEEDYLYQEFSSENAMEKVELDFKYAATTLGPHPVEILREGHWVYDVEKKLLKNSRDLLKVGPNKEVHVFGMVLVRQAPPSAKGMVFFTLEDETGFINLVFAPDVYKTYAESLYNQGFICVRGQLQGREQGYSILVKEVYGTRKNITEIMEIRQTKENWRKGQVSIKELKQPALNFNSVRNFH